MQPFNLHDTIRTVDQNWSVAHYQLSLPLQVSATHHNGKPVRLIPPVVRDLFEVSDESPSGLVWRVDGRGRGIGEMVGSLARQGKNYGTYLVSVKGHGLFYTHRIRYYLETGLDPGAMVVRHTATDLIVGDQLDNLRDERGKPKKTESGYRTKVMYSIGGKLYNLSRLCQAYNLSYSTIYQRIRNGHDPVETLKRFGLENVTIVQEA